jgi:hypothetical protein
VGDRRADSNGRGINQGGLVAEPKVGPTEFKQEAERLRREGKMPSLEALLDAIAPVRAEYREKILAARKGKVSKR